MCVLGLSEPVDSVLTFPSGYDTLQYSWVKATVVSVRLRILFVTLQNTNKLSGAMPRNGSYIIFGLSCPRIFFIFFPSTSTPATLGAAILSLALYPQWASSLSHHHLPHLTMNSTLAL